MAVKDKKQNDPEKNNPKKDELKDNILSDNKKTGSKDKSSSSRKKAAGGLTNTKKKLEETQIQLAEMHDRYIRLTAEFDNYRKRTLKEKMDLVKTGGEQVILNLLPMIDNLERAMVSIRETKDSEALKEGIELIYGKFKEFLAQNGVKEVDSLKAEFDTDVHEAITKIPAPEPELKGKVVDVIERGYYLHDKVVRFAKVVVGE